jgi:hypothetical protein
MTDGGAWVCVAWGALATGMGLLVATDYRGLVDSIIAERAKNAEALRRVPVARATVSRPAPVTTQRRVARLAGGLFGTAGVVVLVIGIVALARRGGRIPAIDLHPHLTVVGVIGGCGIVAMGGWLWRPDGLIRRGWDRGGIRRAAAAGMTLALLVALGGWIPMMPPLFVAGVIVAAPCLVVLSVRDDPGRTAGA